MKKIFIFIFFSIYLSATPILVGSFNVLRLGDVEKDYTSLAKIVSKFDIVALEEVMNEKGLVTLRNELENLSKEKWGYLISEKSVGSKEYKEYYAFIYKKSSINKIESLGFYKGGYSKEFIREPFGVKVLSNKFDFVIISSHSIYGNSKQERREEATRYHKVYKYFKDKSKEEDIILLGDFNLEANDNAFDYFKNIYKVKEILNPELNKTTLSEKGLANSYDNMFFNRKHLKEFTGRFGVYNFTKSNNILIRKYISDHLLIFAEFENGSDLDD